VELIDADTGLTLATTKFGTVPSLKSYDLTQIAFSPDNKTIAISVKQSGKPNKVALLYAKSLDFIVAICCDSRIYGCVFTLDSRLIAIQGRIEIALYIVATRELAAKHTIRTSPIGTQHPMFSYNGSQILHVAQGKVIFRQTKDLAVNRELDIDGRPCHLALSRDERFLAVSMGDGCFRMFSLA
jgi:hypothetical protein